MTQAFFADPENRVVLRICRSSPGFIPVVVNGQLHPVRETNITSFPVSPSLAVEDYVLGLEVLGCRFGRNAIDDVVVEEPATFRSETWRDRAMQIQAVINDHWEGRRTDLSDYLRRREQKAR